MFPAGIAALQGLVFPCMEYFTQGEQEKMLNKFYEFDRKMIHEKYRKVVDQIEAQSVQDPEPGKCL